MCNRGYPLPDGLPENAVVKMQSFDTGHYSVGVQCSDGPRRENANRGHARALLNRYNIRSDGLLGFVV
jgi:hypothetical protein